MSIPRLDPPAGTPEPGEAFQTDLIARLAQEFFRTGPGLHGAVPSSPASLPSPSAPVVPEAPQLPEQGLPQAWTTAAPVDQKLPEGSSPPGRDIALSGGFPSSSSPSAPPPVHPTVVASEEAPQEKRSQPESGTHRPGDQNSEEFGEPAFYTEGLRARVKSSRSPEHGAESGRLAIPGFEEESPDGAGFYFLEGLGGVQSLQRGVAPVSHLPEFDLSGVRRDFPALQQYVNGRPLVWLDNAATTHKPQSVIDATSSFYSRDNSNIHRAAHTLAERSTKLFEAGRDKVRQFLGAASAKEIVFVRGTTEAINLVAQGWGREQIGAGDEILLSQLEHHANIVPWQLLANQVGAKLRVIPINDRGELLLDELPKLITDRTRIVSVTHVSNALGTVNPVEEIISMAHARGVPVLVDGAQSTPHMPINVQALDADFFVFSGHKIFGPTGIGALYGKSHLLEAMSPWQGGGHMIQDVTFEKTIYNRPPEKFEAGTPDIAGVVGLGAAIDYLLQLGIPALAAYEHSLLEYAEEALRSVRGVRPIGTAANKASVFGFVIPGIPNDQIARHLDHEGIAVRAGHHCAMPAVRHFGVETTIRPSLAFYNTREEVDALISALHHVVRR